MLWQLGREGSLSECDAVVAFTQAAVSGPVVVGFRKYPSQSRKTLGFFMPFFRDTSVCAYRGSRCRSPPVPVWNIAILRFQIGGK